MDLLKVFSQEIFFHLSGNQSSEILNTHQSVKISIFFYVEDDIITFRYLLLEVKVEIAESIAALYFYILVGMARFVIPCNIVWSIADSTH